MKNFKLLIKWCYKELWMFIIVILGLLAVGFLSAYEPILVANMFGLLENPNSNILPGFLSTFLNGASSLSAKIIISCLLFFIIMTINALVKQILGFMLNIFGVRVGQHAKNDFYKKLQNIPHEKFLINESSGLIQRCVNNGDAVAKFMQDNLLKFFESLIRVIFVLYQMMLLLPNSTMIVIAITIIMFGINLFFTRLRAKILYKEAELNTQRLRSIKENVGVIRSIKAYNNQQVFLNNFSALDSKYVNIKIRRNSYNAYRRLSLQMLLYASQVAVFIGLFSMLVNGSLELAVALAFFGLYWQWYFQISEVLGQFLETGNLFNAVQRMSQITNAPSAQNLGTLKPEITGRIEFKKVSFKILSRQIILNKSFVIEPGKSAFLFTKTNGELYVIYLLMLKFFSDYSGEILIDGVNINQIDTDYLRKSICVIEKIPFIFSQVFGNFYEELNKISGFGGSEVIADESVITLLNDAKSHSKLIDSKKEKLAESVINKVSAKSKFLLISDISELLNTKRLNMLLKMPQLEGKTILVCGNFNRERIQTNEVIHLDEQEVADNE